MAVPYAQLSLFCLLHMFSGSDWSPKPLVEHFSAITFPIFLPLVCTLTYLTDEMRKKEFNLSRLNLLQKISYISLTWLHRELIHAYACMWHFWVQLLFCSPVTPLFIQFPATGTVQLRVSV